MINCPVCQKPISPSTLSYKASAGFLDIDGVFHEDAKIIVHAECQNSYTYDVFNKLEQDMKDGVV